MTLRPTLVSLTLLGFMGTAQPQTAPPGETTPYRFSTGVDLVLLNIAVRDRKGWFVPDLIQANFAVSEDGVPQTIHFFRHEDIPVAVGLVVDHSGSMASKLPEVIAAAKTFVASSRADDHMFVVNFNDNVTIEKSDQPDQLARSLSSRPTQGKTALYDAVIKALDHVTTDALQKRVLIIISDGGDNASRHNLADVVAAVEESNVLLYTIGIFAENDPDQNKDKDVLRRLAHVSGAEAFFPNQLSEVVSICERIARDIRNQYVVGYVSNNVAKPGVYRSIRLSVRAEGQGRLVARTRSGYISGEAAK